MLSTESPARSVKSVAARVAGSIKLQEVCAFRLQSELVHFMSLSAALARAEVLPGHIFDDLNTRAHRLKDTAAMFERADLAAAAGALEQASLAAATTHARNTDTGVWTALAALVSMLTVIEANSPAIPSLVAACGA